MWYERFKYGVSFFLGSRDVDGRSWTPYVPDTYVPYPVCLSRLLMTRLVLSVTMVENSPVNDIRTTSILKRSVLE